ncbi:hypothetical protein LCGC14_0295370 [marine sediment metagenome]|uniref:Uncharacterized protein n=1 Tax=marine sediment metagenome TaxID=412755 RepID=A0A0F9TX68_9ZZZZ
MTKGKELIVRGPDGLMPAQREYIQKYAELGSEKEARKELNLQNRRVTRWLREDEAFQRAYEEVVTGTHELVRLRLKAIEEEVPEAIRALMAATKPMKITCPFDKTHTFTITVDHPGVRAKMVEMLMKSQGHLKDVRRIEGEVGVIEMTMGQRIALALWKDGKDISAQSRIELIGMGLIDETI